MPAWEQHFPNLGRWLKTSERDPDYNCAAFAAGEQQQRWDPFPPGVYYWPSGVNRSYQIADFIEAYKTRGYSVCADGSLKTDREKIVIYTNQYGSVEHVARQLSDGRWTSKIGDEEDIVHETPESLSVGYGTPTLYMQRHREDSNAGSN
jgi:hypothetical protein